MPSPCKPILIIAGATATGKTQFSVELGKHLKDKSIAFKIINFDSLSFYRELNIGTAKPSIEERQGLPHEMFGHHSITSPLNAADFRREALLYVNELHQRDGLPILVGGSGFYIRALIKGMYPSPNSWKSPCLNSQEIYQREGIAPFLLYLKNHDPQSYATLHPNDHYRLIRAVEYHQSTGTPLSKEKEKWRTEQNPYDFSKGAHPQWKIITLYLNIPKSEHWKIIQKRTEQMLQKGLIKEVENLLQQGFKGEQKALQAIGYKETQDYLKGLLPHRESLRDKINISTRQLAKAQRTFFNKIHPKVSFNPLLERDQILKQVLKEIEALLS